MSTLKISDVIGFINKLAPAHLAEGWDNPGLQVGNPAADVTGIMVALDPAPDVIDSAINSSCQLLVTHHPLIFKPLKSISTSTPRGKLIQTAIKNDLSIACMHTNYDIATGGLNDLLAGMLGLASSTPLQVTKTGELVKLVVFVPDDHIQLVRKALFPHARSQGNYRDCSFTANGLGTFLPTDGATPFIGTPGKHQMVSEGRLELLVDRQNLPKAVKALLAAHPYEEPAFDIYPLFNESDKFGIGRIGRLSESVRLAEYADRIKNLLSAPGLRYVGNPDSKISKVALCSGSGASLLHEAARAGADVLVTGDIKYHDARDAQDLGISLIDAGHFPTEIIMVKEMSNRLNDAIYQSGFKQCRILPCMVERDPFTI